ncbi:MAG: hypothetical protein V4813_11225 [Gemmatimonadota bacterium]
MPPLPTGIPGSGDDAAARRRARRATLITVAVLALLMVLIVLLTPVKDDDGDDRLTTTRFGDGNARLVADLTRRLGWPVRIPSSPLRGTLDTTVIYAVFDGPTPMSLADRNALLQATRRGARLLLAPQARTPWPLYDSLGLHIGKAGLVTPQPLGECPRETDPLSSLRVRTRMLTFDTVPRRGESGRPRVPYPAGARTLLASDLRGVPGQSDDDDDSTSSDEQRRVPPTPRSDTATGTGGDSSKIAARRRPAIKNDAPQLRPTMVAFPLGLGRVVALADPDVLRTDQVRNCAMGGALSIVRGLEYLSDGTRRPVVFAEHYQLVSRDGPAVVLREWLLGSALGRLVLTLLAAALILLLARGRRTLAPVYRQREERRSALEHVDALATAWQTVRGTRTVARLLARGIRRRHAAGRWRTLDDAAFLAALAERHPAVADDVSRLTRAIEVAPAPSDLPALRQAAAHIDAECLTP